MKNLFRFTVNFLLPLCLLMGGAVAHAADIDGDGIEDVSDNCSLISNAMQADLDSDGHGDVCDDDADGDGIDVLPPMISLGNQHTCVLDHGNLRCWGYNSNGQTVVPALTNPVAVSAGRTHTCALDDTGVKCWGDNQSGQTTVPALTNPVAVSAGGTRTCALDDTGVKCWGDSQYAPVLSHPVAVSTGGYHSCALDDNGVHCWGNNQYGQTVVPALTNPVAVSAGRYHTCALDETGVKCWGGFVSNGLANVPDLSHPVAIGSGEGHSCALDDSGVHCWGYNNHGQTVVPALNHPVAISLGAYHTCALDVTGVRCWGYNASGQATVPANISKPDNCPLVANADQADMDFDGIGDVCDSDNDNDGINNDVDNCPLTNNSAQMDADGDGQGDVCDSDDDNDGVADLPDNCPLISNATQADTDGDSQGDACDTDDDNDGLLDVADNCPLTFNPTQADFDGDLIADACDPDDDNDGVLNVNDGVPLDPTETTDTDGDGLGDITDPLPIDGSILNNVLGSISADKLGAAVAFAGDVDKDGYGDYVIGIPGYDVPANGLAKIIKDAGRSVVISGKTGHELMAVQGSSAKEAMGTAVAGNVDIDGDGYSDVVVGAPYSDDLPNKLKDVGSVTVLYGPNGVKPTAVILGTQAQSLFGAAVALGRASGDGQVDIIIGAPKYDAPIEGSIKKLVDAGNVTVLSGADPHGIPLNVFYGATAKAYAGTAVVAGDVNNDTHADIIIGAPNDDAPYNNKLVDAGSVSVYDVQSGDLLLEMYGDVAKAFFGKSVASGYANDDDYADVLVGAPGDDVPSVAGISNSIKDAGSVALFYGNFANSPEKHFGATAKAGLGNSVALVDVGRDDRDEIIAGASLDDSYVLGKVIRDAGSVKVWYAGDYNPNSYSPTVYGVESMDHFGVSVGAGDINRDGKADLIVGIPGKDVHATKLIKDGGSVQVIPSTSL